jgi:hypothetical protein
VIDAANSINRFQRRVMKRERLLALQDHLVIAALAGGLLSSAAILYLKMRTVEGRYWPIAIAVLAVVTIALAARWLLTRPREGRAAFEIDRKLGLEDRIASANSILRRGGPHRAVEEALLDDAASRLKGVDEAAVVPYRFPRWYALGLLGVIALVVALIVPQKAMPGAETLIAERADIESAGEQLEQAAKEVEKFVPPETVTAGLAKEQAELGGALKRSPVARAEALKKLAELEGKIRQRHEELADTRADEIVSLAEKRLRSAVSTKPEQRPKTRSEAGEKPGDVKPAAEKAAPFNPQIKAANASTGEGNSKAADTHTPAEKKLENASLPQPGERSQEKPDPVGTGPSDPVAGKPEKDQKADGQPRNQPQDSKPPDSSAPQPEPGPGSPPLTPQEKAGENQPADASQKPEGSPDPTNPLTGMMAEQAARAVPNMSEELLKKAGQLRAGELRPEDIRQLAKAAELLARDLAPIAQSKEFQQAVAQLAKQVDPAQLERVARELMNQESIRREVEAAARLLMQNREAREMAAGIARQLEQMEQRRPGPEARRPDNSGRRRPGGDSGTGDRSGDSRGGAGRGSPNGQSERLAADSRITGQGKEDKLSGKLQKKDGGEYLFLQTRPEVGASRVPYSSAYPRYRREAERSVERSQIPANMRKVVRSYFDRINPDAGKKP